MERKTHAIFVRREGKRKKSKKTSISVGGVN